MEHFFWQGIPLSLQLGEDRTGYRRVILLPLGNKFSDAKCESAILIQDFFLYSVSILLASLIRLT